jgi:hypothetical protein
MMNYKPSEGYGINTSTTPHSMVVTRGDRNIALQTAICYMTLVFKYAKILEAANQTSGS